MKDQESKEIEFEILPPEEDEPEDKDDGSRPIVAAAFIPGRGLVFFREGDERPFQSPLIDVEVEVVTPTALIDTPPS